LATSLAAGALAAGVWLATSSPPLTARAQQATPAAADDGQPGAGRAPSPVAEVITIAEGNLQGSLYDSAARAGADPALIEQAASLFARRLDFARDLAPGDHFRLVFRRTITPAGDTVETGALLYAEIDRDAGVSRFYAITHDGRTEFLDSTGGLTSSRLLRTPVDGARVSSVFGMRHHPILGYSRMHQGVDFAAPAGTPVVAAGDGVVVEAQSLGGYGRWLRIRHAGGWDTAYAHLSAYAAGVRPGLAVRQGEVVGFVGATGEATGPHLHYEVWKDGDRVDPATVPQSRGGGLQGKRLALFASRKAWIDALLAAPGPERPTTAVALRLSPQV